ncbi:MAG: hypothetical protein LBG42_01700, partial [Treponema sp.]|nr:hypothetical protein [Treponema sp.]
MKRNGAAEKYGCLALFFFLLFIVDLCGVFNGSFHAARGRAELLFPPDNYTASETLVPELHFIWKEPGGLVQIARDGDFADMVLEANSPGTMYRAPALSPGTYYWRVLSAASVAPATAPVATTGEAVQKTYRRLFVAPPPPPPELEPPRAGFTGLVDDELVAVLAPGKAMRFSWNDRGADYYLFRLYSAETENAGLRLLESRKTHDRQLELSLDGHGEGNYLWSAQPVVAGGKTAGRQPGLASPEGFSLRKARSVSLDYPPVDSEIPWLDLLRGRVEFRWSSMDDPAQT